VPNDEMMHEASEHARMNIHMYTSIHAYRAFSPWGDQRDSGAVGHANNSTPLAENVQSRFSVRPVLILVYQQCVLNMVYFDLTKFCKASFLEPKMYQRI
jgi:hypothetical protein